MTTKELTTLQCEVVNYIPNRGYVVLLLHESVEGQSKSWLALDSETHHAYEVESALEGFRLIKSGFTLKATPVRSSVILRSKALLGEFKVIEFTDSEVTSTQESEDLSEGTITEVTDQYEGKYHNIAVKVASMILSNPDDSTAKWALTSLLKDVYDMTLSHKGKFLCSLSSGHVIVDSERKVAKYLPYHVDEEIDLEPMLSPITIDVIYDNPASELSIEELIELSIRVAVDFTSACDEIDEIFATEVTSYKDYPHYKKFMKLHGTSLADLDMSDFESLLRRIKVKESYLEFTSSSRIDDEGIIESDISHQSVSHFVVNESSQGKSSLQVSFSESAPVNEVMNILKATCSAITNP